MATVRAEAIWSGAESDIVTLLVDGAQEWEADPNDGDWLLYTLRDADDAVVGVQIFDFLRFDAWDELPWTDALWHLPDQEPAPLETALRRLQAQVVSDLAHVGV